MILEIIVNYYTTYQKLKCYYFKAQIFRSIINLFAYSPIFQNKNWYCCPE